jgi:hypothetical protein
MKSADTKPNKTDKDYQAIIDAGIGFLRAHPQLVQADPYLTALIYDKMAWAMRQDTKNSVKAFDVLDEGIKLLQKSFERHILVGHKAEFLIQDKKTKEAEVLLANEWPNAEAEDLRRVSYLAFPYSSALERQGKGKEAGKLLIEMQRRHPSTVTYFPFEWMPKLMIPTLIKSGSLDEALSWAKLFWMTCPFTEDEINDSTQRLMKVWVAKDLTAAKGQAFIKAQEDSTAVNPLRDVKIPEFNPELLQAELAKEGRTHERLTLYMLQGDWHQAMIVARANMIKNIDNPDAILEVCRVFKAADLNLVRANAFLEYVKTGNGENPVAAFLKEHPENQVPVAQEK